MLQKLLSPAQNSMKSSSAFTIKSFKNNFSGDKNLCNIKSSNVELSTGKVLDAPKQFVTLGLLKITFTCIAGLTVGSWMSKAMVAVLEDYELYIHEEGDDDD